MCTLIIDKNTDSVIATFNRDEQKSRSREVKPDFYGNSIYPIDLQSGGTWIATTSNKNAYFILNRYDKISYKPEISRGLIIKQLIDGLEVECLNLKKIAPFRLVCLNTNDKKILEYSWNGIDLSDTKHNLENYFITSSSLEEAEVTKWRKDNYNEWLSNNKPYIDDLPEFNVLCKKNHESYSPKVMRENTFTKSICQISYSDKNFFRYFPEPFKNNNFKTHEIIF